MNDDRNAWVPVGLMVGTNPSRMVIKFRDSNEKLMIRKLDFALLVRGLKDQAIITSRDMTQTVLLDAVPEEYAGKAELSQSGKAIRLSLKDGRALYVSRSGARHVLERQEVSCQVSEVGA